MDIFLKQITILIKLNKKTKLNTAQVVVFCASSFCEIVDGNLKRICDWNFNLADNLEVQMNDNEELVKFLSKILSIKEIEL